MSGSISKKIKFIEVVKEHQTEVYLKLQLNERKTISRSSKMQISNIKGRLFLNLFIIRHILKIDNTFLAKKSNIIIQV